MKTTLPILILILCFSTLNAQLNLTSSPVQRYDVRYFSDPVTNDNWAKVQMRVWSTEKIDHNNTRYRANIDFFSRNGNSENMIEMRLKLKTNINEWPISKKAFVIINNESYEIELTDVNSQFYQIDDEETTTDTDGISSTVVSTRDFQLFRKVANLTTVLKEVDFLDSFSIVVYSGGMPIEFGFDNGDMNRLMAIL